MNTAGWKGLRLPSAGVLVERVHERPAAGTLDQVLGLANARRRARTPNIFLARVLTVGPGRALSLDPVDVLEGKKDGRDDRDQNDQFSHIEPAGPRGRPGTGRSLVLTVAFLGLRLVAGLDPGNRLETEPDDRDHQNQNKKFRQTEHELLPDVGRRAVRSPFLFCCRGGGGIRAAILGPGSRGVKDLEGVRAR